MDKRLVPVAGVLIAALVWRCGGGGDIAPIDGGQGAEASSNDRGSPPPTDAPPSADAPLGVDAPPTPDATPDSAPVPDATPDSAPGADAGRDATADARADTGADGGGCLPTCGFARNCCDGKCTNPSNDPFNCGGCGVRCGGATPHCDGTCKPLPCSRPGCGAGTTCCGALCCASGDICCKTEGPIATAPQCFSPSASQPTCPMGCAPLCISDRNQKQDITPVDEREVLEAVSRMPVATWSYKTDPSAARHIGPMAQDFRSAFGVGSTSLAYDPVDAHGVAFASIKALYGLLREQDERIDRLERENRALKGRSAGGPMICAPPMDTARDSRETPPR